MTTIRRMMCGGSALLALTVASACSDSCFLCADDPGCPSCTPAFAGTYDLVAFEGSSLPLANRHGLVLSSVPAGAVMLDTLASGTIELGRDGGFSVADEHRLYVRPEGAGPFGFTDRPLFPYGGTGTWRAERDLFILSYWADCTGGSAYVPKCRERDVWAASSIDATTGRRSFTYLDRTYVKR